MRFDKSAFELVRAFGRMNQTRAPTLFIEISESLAITQLLPGCVSRKVATARRSKPAPEPVPIVLLARLAVGKQRQALGSVLLKDAVHRTYAGVIGGRAVLVHVIDREAQDFAESMVSRAAPTSNSTSCC